MGTDTPSVLDAWMWVWWAAGHACRYQERIWEEVDPDTADRLREADSDLRRKEEALGHVRSQIESERSALASCCSILRNLHRQCSTDESVLVRWMRCPPLPVPSTRLLGSRRK